MHPILISFRFPAWVGRLSWLEIGLTVLLIAGLFLLRRRRRGFSPTGFLIGVAVYVALRGLVLYAGAGYHFRLHTYGVLVALGFVVAIFVAVRQARREFIDPNVVLDLSFWILVAAMVGSRVLYIIVNIDDYIADPLGLLKIWTGGLVFYGGFLGAVGVSIYYCHRKKISFLRVSDLMIPSVALGHVFGRLGCFAAGCCHGSTTGSDSFGAVYTATNTVVSRSNLLGQPLHPTPLYEAFGELLIFGLLVWMRPRKRKNGQLLAAWLLLYPVLRIVTEMFRGDVERGILAWVDVFGDPLPEFVSTSQVVSLGLLGLGVWMFAWLGKQPTGAELAEGEKAAHDSKADDGDASSREGTPAAEKDESGKDSE